MNKPKISCKSWYWLLMQNKDSPITPDLVLIGGGLSHLFVLKHFAMNPQPGLSITLVTSDLHTP
jgi:selenide,water dikinase